MGCTAVIFRRCFKGNEKHLIVIFIFNIHKRCTALLMFKNISCRFYIIYFFLNFKDKSVYLFSDIQIHNHTSNHNYYSVSINQYQILKILFYFFIFSIDKSGFLIYNHSQIKQIIKNKKTKVMR